MARQHSSTSRPPSPARATAHQVLNKMRGTGDFAKELLHSNLEAGGLSTEDRSLATELVYGAIRHQITLDHIIEFTSGRPARRIQPPLLDALRLGVYQILYFQRVPPHATVHETVNLVRHRVGEKAAGFANAILRSLLREIEWPQEAAAEDPRRVLPGAGGRSALFAQPLFPSPSEDPAGYLSLTRAHPRWLLERWIPRFGYEVTQAICEANNRPPPIHVRWRGGLEVPPGLVPFKGLKGLFFLNHGGKISDLPGFNEGHLLVQGPASALAVQALQVEPGMDVLDVCAAPGVKTVHLADLAAPGGHVLAVDNSWLRITKLKENMTRLRIINIRLIVGDATRLGDWLIRPFPRILLDLPCSNTGELARRVEVRHRLNLGDIGKLKKLQSLLLHAASQLVEKSGVMVYSTCSLEEEEGPGVIHPFLQAQKAFRLDEERWLFPQDHGSVGGYIARLVNIQS